jgi:ABC-type transport system substrate-binding protein
MGDQSFKGFDWVKLRTGDYGIEARFTYDPDLEAAKQLFKSLGLTDGEITMILLET